MSGLGRSISTMSFGSGEREQLAHQFSGNVGGALGSAPALAKTGAPSRPCCLRAAGHVLTSLAHLRMGTKSLHVCASGKVDACLR